jgi:sec-independent protein translocase protein TatA
MQDWMIVVVIAVIVIFGASKLPQLARNVGKAQTEFKKGLREGASEADADEPAPPPAATPQAAAPQETAPPAGEQPQPPAQA